MPLQLSWQLTAPPDTALRVLAVAHAYMAHACVWSAAAWLALRATTLAAATRHLFWRSALLGPFLTVSMTLALPVDVDQALTHVTSLHDSGASSLAGGGMVSAGLPLRAAAVIVVTTLALGACLGLLRFGLLFWRVRRELRGRTPVRNPRLLQRLEHVRARTALRSVALSECSELRVPLVLGPTELCVPLAKLQTLDDAELDAVFAHELAHLERRDGLWFPLLGLVQSVLWMQPLNHWLARRCRHTAELACDDRAVELTADPLALARALVQLAAGASRLDQSALLPAMAHAASVLLPRVKRLVASDAQRAARETRSDRSLALAAFLALGLATLSIRVHVAHEQRPKPVPSGALATQTSLRPDADQGPSAETLSNELDALLARERELVTQLELTQRQATGQMPVHILELHQELRHVREAEAWTEARWLNSTAR